MSEEKKNKKEKNIDELKKELKEELKKEVLEEILEEEKKKDSKKEKKEDKSFEEKAKEAVDKIMDTQDNTKDYDKKDIETNKIMAILAYFGPLCFVPYFASKESKFAMYHAKQGLNLFIIECIVGVISYFLTSVFEFSKMCNIGGNEYVCGVYTPFWITIPVELVQLVIGLIALVGLVFACQGKAKELPILGKIKIIK